jgi:hypothetical protein
MMRAYLFLFLIVFSSLCLGAREIPPEPVRGAGDDERVIPTRDAPTRVIPESKQDKTPALTGLIGLCARPGDMLTIEGKNLSALDKKAPALEVNNKALLLKILSKTNNRFVIRLPQDGLEPNKTYALLLADKNNLIRFEKTDLTVRLCPTGISDIKNEDDVGEILVFADQEQKPSILSELHSRSIDIIKVHNLAALGSVLITIRSTNASELVKELRIIFPEVEIDLNSNLFAATNPRLYAKEKINWPQKNSCVGKANNTPIGLIDGEIDITHSAFVGQNIISRNFLTDQQVDKQHATAIASILIGKASEQGFDGLLPDKQLYNAIVLSRTGDKQLASIEGTVLGLNWLLTNHVRLINVSLAGNKPNRVIIKSFGKAIKNGALIFAAVGNEGPDAPPSYPAAIKEVFAVTAVDSLNRIYHKANRGNYIDFAAPGVDIWSAVPGERGNYQSGTSYAVPYVLALAAQYLSKNNSLSRELVMTLLKEGAEDLGRPAKDDIYGWGLIKANAMLCKSD